MKDKIKQYLDVVKSYMSDRSLKEDASYLAFVLTLLPIPGVQQAGLVIDRILTNDSLKNKLDCIWAEINTINTKISETDDVIIKIQEIAGTFKYNASLDNKLNVVTQEIVSDIQKQSEWIVETENWSCQSILSSIVDTDFAQIIARDNSSNTVENTKIKAEKTHLHASNNSRNHFDRTTFIGKGGSVQMNGISTSGNIMVEDSGIGFGLNSGITFGGNPYILTGECPFCHTILTVDKRKLAGYNHVKCCKCMTELSFTID